MISRRTFLKAASSTGILLLAADPPVVTRATRPARFSTDCLADALVSRALAHVIDRTGAGFVALGECAVAQIGHPVVDHRRAITLLEEVGWSQVGDVWTMPSGEQARFDLTFPPNDAGVRAAAHFIAQNLTDFGLRCDARAVVSRHSIPAVPLAHSPLLLTGGRAGLHWVP